MFFADELIFILQNQNPKLSKALHQSISMITDQKKKYNEVYEIERNPKLIISKSSISYDDT